MKISPDFNYNDYMEIELIIIGIFAVVLLIVIISALAKKKKLNGFNHIDSTEMGRVSSDDRTQAAPQQSAQTRRNSTKRKKSNDISRVDDQDVYSSLLYYVNLDGNTYGPFSLEQLKTYPLLEDTLITTNTLNGTWYETKYFECLDDLFCPNLPFRIDADGTIIRIK